MPQNISKKSLKRHREVVANSFFPYISKSLGASVPREPHLLSPLHPDARRTGGAGTKTARQSPLQHIIPPTEPCNPLRLEQLELETRTLLSNRANAEKQESLLPQPGVDRMPSTTENSLDPEVWTIKERNVLLEDDEARLLGNFGRNYDDAAIPISRPTTRPMLKPQVKIPAGGPKPKNTLHGGFKAQRPQLHQTSRGKLRGGEIPGLLLQASRGDNVSPISHKNNPQEIWPMSSPKRQKISHPVSSPMSGNSTDELDQLLPDNVSFGPSQKSNQAISIHSFNSQGSGFQSRRHGSTNGLTEHWNVERMMNSNKPTRKQKRREANQNQYSKREFPASTERSSPSQLVDMSSHDEGEGVNSKSSIIHQTSDSGTVSQISHEMKSHKGKISIKPQSPSTGHRSPYFHEPQLPSNRPHAAPKHSRNPVEDLANGHNSPKRLDDRFIPTNGSRRSLDVNMSSEADELQMGTTIGNNPDSNVLSSIKRPRDKSPGKNMPLTVTTISSTGKDPGLDPSIIKHSEFKSTEPKLPNDRFSGPPVREKKAPWAVDVAAVSLPGHLETRTGMDLVHDERMGSYILKIDGQDSGIRVLPRKLQKIYWEHSGRKVRFMSSKIGTEENLVDLEFLREKQVHDLLVRLETLPGCKPIGRSSEQMEKMFEKRRSEYQRNTTSSPLNPSRLIEPRLDENGAQLPKVHQETIVNTEKARNEPRKRSIVDDLLARAFPEDPVKATRLSTKTIPNGLPREKSISEQLERLKPKHNEHLRRSIRTSSEFKVPYTDHLDDLDEMPTIERYSKTHDLGEPWKKPLIYPKIGRKKVTIEFTDLERLDEGQYLNDNLLSFYLRFLEHSLEEQRPDLAKRVYFFNTYFFATLMNTHKGKKGFNYEGVQKWTRNVDLFTYDYIVVPINEASHWYLAIICNLPALDRDISLREESPSLSANTVNINDASRLSAPTSSPTIDLSMGKPLDTIRKAKDPDEREARDSFAEMSLNPDVTLSSADDVTRRENPASGNAGSMDEDQEMLDGMNQGATSPRTDEAAIPADNLEEIAEKASQDQYQNRKVAARSKKAKRKSGPPAVTRTPPDKPVIITFDSLGVARSPTVKILKDYLREEAKAKRGGMEFEPGQIKGITASQIPQQDNFYDCGVFLLGYVAKFLEADPKDFIAKIIRREYDEIKDWPNLRPSTLRNSIREQVIKLHEDQAVERHRERNAQKNGKGDITQEQKSHQNSTAAVDQAKELDSEPRPPSIEAASAKAKFPPQPATRKDALTTALTLDADNVKAKIQDISSQYKPKSPMQLTQQELKDQEAVLKPAKREAAECEKEKQRLPDPSDNGTPVVLIESQSQRDDSAPKSSTGSQLTYLAHNLNQKSPELPAEIQDSQPSQTTQKAPKKDESGASDQTELVQEIPIVQLEDPRGTKRRKTGKAAVSAEDDTPGTSTETNQANTSSKRKTSGRKAQRSDEVINIDD